MIKLKEPSLILIDGFSYIYRAYYMFPHLTNSFGEYTGAIYGVLNIFNNFLIKYKPSHILVVFDAPGKNFRHILFKKYKFNRPSMPKNLSQQISKIYEIVQAMGLPIISVNGVEADDVIGTLALQSEISGINVLIISEDKDMTQLVSKKITLVNSTSRNIFNPITVEKKFGISPELIIDYLALTGDRSDNIPGVYGIGDKIAKTLLNKIGGITTLYKNLDDINILNFRNIKYIINTLKKNKKIAFLSYKLAKIKTDVTIDLSYSQMLIKNPKYKILSLLFNKYEFK